MDRSVIFARIWRIKRKYLRVIAVLMAQALDAPGSPLGMDDAGTVGWREPKELGERILRHKLTFGGTLQEAAREVLPD